MAFIVNINGKLLQKREANISIFDHGFLFGDSVYEVLITRKGKLFTVKEHFDRLNRSAREISLKIPWNFSKFKSEIIRTIKKGGNKESYVRIIVTRGVGDINIDPSSCKRQNIIIIINGFNGYPEEYYTKGVDIVIVDVKRNNRESIDPAIKTGNYLNSVLAIIEAKKKKAYDGLMMNMNNFISECTTSNFYIVKKGIVFTPSVDCGILEGVTRRLVLDVAKDNGIKVEETYIKKDEVFKADEAFVTSTTKGVMPVTRCDGKKINKGIVGPVTKELIKLYNKRLDEISFLY